MFCHPCPLAASVIGRSTEWTWDSALPEVVQKVSTPVEVTPDSVIPMFQYFQRIMAVEIIFAAWNFQPQSSVSALDKSKKRLVVFVLGGILQSEMRCAYEVSKELNCEVFIGGSS